jgi:hypothetical protein
LDSLSNNEKAAQKKRWWQMEMFKNRDIYSDPIYWLI